MESVSTSYKLLASSTMINVCNNSPYTREQAAYPLPWLEEKKFWPTVSRIDDGQCFIV